MRLNHLANVARWDFLGLDSSPWDSSPWDSSVLDSSGPNPPEAAGPVSRLHLPCSRDHIAPGVLPSIIACPFQSDWSIFAATSAGNSSTGLTSTQISSSLVTILKSGTQLPIWMGSYFHPISFQSNHAAHFASSWLRNVTPL